ncbi:aspartic proteinase nepenthesin-1-like [Typha latifolia]|uniref:aspartic proteinase nepenthesin-1-like n=1 Tax=Typha latifolia TaxID=4733 RepID=UPI003C2EA630
MQNVKLTQMLLLIALLLPTISASLDIRMDLTHVDAAGNFTKFELVQRMALRSKARATRLLSTATDPISAADVPVFRGEGEYLIDLTIGTPPLPFSAILDTGSDLIWTQCKPCNQCFSQPTPLFDPSNSSSFSTLSCGSSLCKSLTNSACQQQECVYYYPYGDKSSTSGVLSSETFILGSQNKVAVPNLGFGCGVLQQGDFSNASGLVGFGRGPLSLVSQLGVTQFSYCFTSFNETISSTLLFGSPADLNSSTNIQIQTTSLITNPLIPSFYYLSLNGITVGNTLLPIPKSAFALKQNGTGGFIIDSGTSVTQLNSDAYKVVKTAFLSQIKLPVANGSSVGLELDLCFALPSSAAAKVDVPKLVFHFEGADLELPRENYMIEDSGLMCLVMSEWSSDLPGSILGNFQQQNMRILYDLENNNLSFAPAQCDQL